MQKSKTKLRSDIYLLSWRGGGGSGEKKETIYLFPHQMEEPSTKNYEASDDSKGRTRYVAIERLYSPDSRVIQK